MNRQIIYDGEIPRSIDINLLQRNAMVGLGYLIQATLGSSPIADGLGCTPLAVGLGVSISPGSLSAINVVDNVALGSMPADTVEPIMKMAVNLQSWTTYLTAPTTPGQSTSFLIQASFLEALVNPLTMPFFNSANPGQTLSGQGNSGQALPTQITQTVSLQLKAGPPAATGTQQAPAADYGSVPLWVITINAGATSVTAANVSMAPGAPFLSVKLPNAAPLVSPGFSGLPTAPTAAAGDKSALLATTAFVGTAVSAAAASLRIGAKSLAVFVTPGANSFTVPPGVYNLNVELIGGGGAGGSGNSSNTGAGGGAGGYARAPIAVTPGQQIPYIIGASGLSASGGNQGGNGGTTSFGVWLSATGGTGGGGGSSSSPAGGGGGQGYGNGLILVGGYGADGQTGGLTFGGQGGASFFGGGGRAGTGGGLSGGGAGSGGGGSYLNNGLGSGTGGFGMIVIEYTQIGV